MGIYWKLQNSLNKIVPLFRLQYFEVGKKDHQDEQWLLFRPWTGQTFSSDTTWSSHVPLPWTWSFRSAGCKPCTARTIRNQKQSLPNMPASKINILAESRTRGCSCHGRNRYQRCRLLSRQMETWSQRKVRNAGLNVTLYSASLMASKQVDTISKPTIHLGRMCRTFISSSMRASSGRDSPTTVVCSYSDCDIDILDRERRFDDLEISSKAGNG